MLESAESWTLGKREIKYSEMWVEKDARMSKDRGSNGELESWRGPKYN